jgi:hypothetical protein
MPQTSGGASPASLRSLSLLFSFAFLALAYLIDPYDTGRSKVCEARRPSTGPAHGSREPRPQPGVQRGGSWQIAHPASVAGTEPKEHFVLIDWFLRHRPSPPQALIIGAEPTWCTFDPAMPNAKPVEYVRGLLSYDMLEEVPRRLAYAFQDKAERARRDGYWDYEPDYIGQGYDTPTLRARLEQRVGDWGPAVAGRFPVAEKLKAVISNLPSDTALLLVGSPPVGGDRLAC